MNCQLCKTDAPVSEDSIMCQECYKHTTEAQRVEFARINDEYGWSYGRGFKPDHFGVMFNDIDYMSSSTPALPFVALLHIFVMLTHVCKNSKDYMRVSMNFLLAMRCVSEPRVFLNHLRAQAPRYHKMWHDFLMLAKYSPYLHQTIPNCVGQVCYVSPERNPQIAKTYIDGTSAISSYQSYRQETTIACCSCSHQTMCETEEECFHHDMPADGNCNVIDTDATDRNRNDYDWELFDYKQSDVDEFAIDFFTTAEKAYQKKFLSELRYNIWLLSAQKDETEPVIEHVKPDTQRIIRETARMRLEKTKQKNSRRPRQMLFVGSGKGSNAGKNKSRRDVCLD